jgi:hypothetical protein
LKFYFPHWDGPVECLKRGGGCKVASWKCGRGIWKSAGLSEESAGKASNLMRRPVQ